MQGAAALITTPAYLTAAAGILATEAYHAGSIREQLIQNSSYTVSAYGVEVNQIVGVRMLLRMLHSNPSCICPNDQLLCCALKLSVSMFEARMTNCIWPHKA